MSRPLSDCHFPQQQSTVTTHGELAVQSFMTIPMYYILVHRQVRYHLLTYFTSFIHCCCLEVDHVLA